MNTTRIIIEGLNISSYILPPTITYFLLKNKIQKLDDNIDLMNYKLINKLDNQHEYISTNIYKLDKSINKKLGIHKYFFDKDNIVYYDNGRRMTKLDIAFPYISEEYRRKYANEVYKLNKNNNGGINLDVIKKLNKKFEKDEKIINEIFKIRENDEKEKEEKEEIEEGKLYGEGKYATYF